MGTDVSRRARHRICTRLDGKKGGPWGFKEANFPRGEVVTVIFYVDGLRYVWHGPLSLLSHAAVEGLMRR